ncbi:hypothetical protein HDV02_006023 [Globomyces sp. JEL0801]|nr:hypothetical protein HDV02_006023 [Globomyces sp. JEL0801]
MHSNTTTLDSDTLPAKPIEPLVAKKTKGKQKKPIEYIPNKNMRQETFYKRKAGIIKKVHELAVLTGNQILLVMKSDANNVFSYATTGFQEVFAEENHQKTLTESLDVVGITPKQIFENQCITNNQYGKDEAEKNSRMVDAKPQTATMISIPDSIVEESQESGETPVDLEEKETISPHSNVQLPSDSNLSQPTPSPYVQQPQAVQYVHPAPQNANTAAPQHFPPTLQAPLPPVEAVPNAQSITVESSATQSSVISQSVSMSQPYSSNSVTTPHTVVIPNSSAAQFNGNVANIVYTSQPLPPQYSNSLDASQQYKMTTNPLVQASRPVQVHFQQPQLYGTSGIVHNAFPINHVSNGQPSSFIVVQQPPFYPQAQSMSGYSSQSFDERYIPSTTGTPLVPAEVCYPDINTLDYYAIDPCKISYY